MYITAKRVFHQLSSNNGGQAPACGLIDACVSAGSGWREGEGLKGVHDEVVVVVIVAIVIRLLNNDCVRAP